eukprot:s1151_g9.t1
MLPVKGDKAAKPEEGCVKQLVAIIKGSLPTCTPADFPVDCEEACKRLVSFLTLWFPTTNNKKTDERKAFKQACGRLKAEEITTIVNALHSYKSWLLRKQRNLKTGEKTDPVIKSLLHILIKPEMAEQSNMSQSSGSKETITAPATEPVKRLRKKQSIQHKEEVEESEQPKPAKALRFAFSSPSSQLSSPARSIMTISSGEVVGHQSMSEAEGPEPAKAVKKPASKNGCKRPAAKKKQVGREGKLAKAKKEEEPEKAEKEAEPAKADHKGEPGKAKRTKRPWVSSQSFGMVHETRANKKAYIQAKASNDEKPYCLVNVEVPAGDQQTKIMDDLFAKAQEAGWTKESLVDHKKSLVQA